MYNCGVRCTCHEKKLSTAPLRATLGTLRAGSPFRVLPQPSLESMSALSAPSTLSHTVRAQNQNSKIQDPESKIENPKKNPKSKESKTKNQNSKKKNIPRSPTQESQTSKFKCSFVGPFGSRISEKIRNEVSNIPENPKISFGHTQRDPIMWLRNFSGYRDAMFGSHWLPSGLGAYFGTGTVEKKNAYAACVI